MKQNPNPLYASVNIIMHHKEGLASGKFKMK